MIAVVAVNVEPNLAAPDEFYEALIDAHRGLTMAQSQSLNARLILILANHVGELDILRDALGRARRGVGDAAAGETGQDCASVSPPTSKDPP